MDDWRLRDQELYLINAKLHKVNFPDFWIASYNSKNEFYIMVYKDAYAFVEQYNRGAEYLSGIEIGKFWHAHCDFCMGKIETDQEGVCYCTSDYQTWICKDCFNDFCNKFHWTVEDIQSG